MALRIEHVKNVNGEIRTFANVATAQEHAKAVKVKVTKETEGPVTFVQKVQGYYKAIVAFVGVLLLILQQVSPLQNLLPANLQHPFTVAVGTVTAISVLLTKNQTWVDSL